MEKLTDILEDCDACGLHLCMVFMDVQSWRRLSTHSRPVDSVPSTYAKTAYKRLSFTQRIFVSELVSLCFHVLRALRECIIKRSISQLGFKLWYDTCS